MKAGPALDAKVATEVMGWKECVIAPGYWQIAPREVVDKRDFRPSRSLHCSMEVIKLLGDQRVTVSIEPMLGGLWGVCLTQAGETIGGTHGHDTLPEAVAIGAVLAARNAKRRGLPLLECG